MVDAKSARGAEDSVRAIVKNYGKKKKPPVSVGKADKPPGLRTIPVAEQRQMVKTKRTIQSQANKQKGTYDTYDPLKSLASNTKVAKRTARKTKKS